MKRLSKPGPDGYDPDRCAVLRCKAPSEIIDATRKLSDHDIPLCTDCWIALDEQRMAVEPKHVEKPEPEPDPDLPTEEDVLVDEALEEYLEEPESEEEWQPDNSESFKLF